MTAFDRHEADRLLTRLLDLPSEERRAALDAACDDPALRGVVLRLVRAAEAPESSVDPDGARSRRLWTGLATSVSERESPMADYTVLGSYRILEEIDRGGMAVVYRAERVDGEFTREVAVKILKLGIDTEEVVRRFEQERQILADLDHPNIARLFDGGRTEDGRPYIVMELVEGVPIDRYSDERRLSVDERLALFCVVAKAVEYAHQNLVVHRDLKPSNILVNEAGEVKLLNFDIARLLDMKVGDMVTASATQSLVRMMTPEYASPEQLRGERVTTASDVYQLGLLLYELLTGHRAYVLGNRGVGEVERVICEQAPTRPSAAVFREETLKRSTVSSAASDEEAEVESPERTRRSGDGSAAVEALCRARRLSPARLRRRLRGDLDNIVLKALRKEPERRYGSADRLARDIRRHLDGQPVSARADTWSYRGRKFLERHALGASAAAAVLVLVGSLTAFYAVRIQNERDQAQAERRRAQAEAAKAEQVSQFLTGLFESVDPREARGVELTARELLDRGVTQVDRELAAQPETQAEMLRVLGRTYSELGFYDSAESLLTRALELRRSRLGSGHPDIAEALGDLGVLRYRQGDYERTQELLDEAIAIFEGSPGGDAPELAEVLKVLGDFYLDLGEHGKSRAALERALTIESRASGEDTEPSAGILSSLAKLFVETGVLQRAERLYERALRIQERELGADHPQVGTTLMRLATVRMEQGTLEGLEGMYRRNLAIQEKAYGPGHARVGMALNNLGHFLTLAGRNDEAIECLERALEVLSSALGPHHPGVAYPLASLGDAHMTAGRLREAQTYYQRSAAVRQEPLDVHPFDPILAYSLARLGRVEAELGNRVAAERVFGHALAIWRQSPESTDPRLAPTLLDLGRWLTEQQRCTEAVPLLQRAVRLERARQIPSSEQVAELETLLQECSAESSDTVAAEA